MNDLAARVNLLSRRLRVALGHEPGDLLLRGGKIVDVFTQDIWPGDVVIADGYIAGVGSGPWTAKESIDCAGDFVLPGLIDAHIHIESTLLLPAELARVVVPRGTTAVIADPHELANVLGVEGIDLLIAASRGLPLDCFFMASSCVPASRWEEAGGRLDPEAIGKLLHRPEVLGLAEMMDFPALLAGQPAVLGKVAETLASHRPVDGHAPMLHGRELAAYVSAGIRSDHESTSQEEAREKARLGMMIQVREGSAEKNLDELLPLLTQDALGDWSLATDDIFPTDLRDHGHLDCLIARLIAGGVPPARAIRHATLVPARHYRLLDRGAVAPSYRADLLLVPDLREFCVRRVYKEGRLAAENGRYCFAAPAPEIQVKNTVKLPPLRAEQFRLTVRQPMPVVGLIPGQIVTRRLDLNVPQQDGVFQFDPAADVLLTANIERHGGSGRVGLGLVSGFGLRQRGALGSSVGHDAHNLVIAGTHGEEMLAAAHELARLGGGFVVVSNGDVIARLPLPVAGLLSTSNVDTVCAELRELDRAAASLGCQFPAPFGILSFLALSVIPALRITTYGTLDVARQEIVA